MKEIPTYRIRDWDKHFENSESRKYKSLTWVPVKNKHDGKGYRRVVAHPKSAQVLCAWYLIVQVASKMPTRGVLRDDDGPLTTSDLSFKTGFPESMFEIAISVLVSKEICWMEVIPSGNLRRPPEMPGETTVEQNRTEQKEYDKASDQALRPARLTPEQKEIADNFESRLGDQWTNDAGKWVGRIKSDPAKAIRVYSELALAGHEGRIATTPAQYAEQIWKEFK